MATKAPGIYFNEYDNTAFTNPKSVSGTTVCVVGFAKKGKIGVPTEITSYKDYTSKFGKPVEGYYSALAVKNVLTAGGKVLFVRVADSTATTSNIVIKNEIKAENGKAFFDRNNDILVGTAGYKLASIYGINVTNSEGASKDIYLRSPASGKFTQASILSQLNDGLQATPGSYEVLKRNAITSGVYSFEIKRNNEIIDDTGAEIEPGNQGFFIETLPDEDGATLAEVLQQAINNGTNSYCAIDIVRNYDTTQEKYFDVDTITFDNFLGNKKFKIQKGTNTIPVEINIVAGSTLPTIVKAIDDKLIESEIGVRCILYKGKPEGDIAPKILFINKSGSTDDIDITSMGDTESTEEFFLTNNVSTEEVYNAVSPVGTENPHEEGWYELVEGNYILTTDETVEDGKTYYAKTTTIVSNVDGILPSITVKEGFYVNEKANRSIGASRNMVNVVYNENTKSIIFEGTEVGEGNKIEVVAAPYGEFIFGASGANVGPIVGSFEGTNELTGINIARDENTKKIYLESSNDIRYPILADTAANNEFILSLINIEKDVNDPTSKGYTYKEGKIPVSSSERDMVVFTSKEKGSGTAGIIDIEFYSIVSPITGEARHDLTISVDGVLKETYENVSYNYADVENRFDTIINQEADNGGSAYVTALVVKKDLAAADVQINDGIYTIGAPFNSDSVKRLPDVEINSYELYDYSVGTDGIPDDGGDECFEEVMAADVSPLADKDLFSFHVIITPDNISETVQTAAIALCENRGDAMAIIDPPLGLSRDNVINWHNGRGFGRSTALQSTYGATYWPWCKVYDTNQAKNIWVMPSVVMAAKYVTVDRTAGCWFAPAGETNGVMSVIDIEQYPNVIDRDKLYVDYNRINPFIRLGDGSIVCYGEKTLQRTNSVLTKVHTRRLLVQVKKEAKEALRGYIFMPNTSENLSKISTNLTAIFEKYKSGGGISYYSVICDETNNPIEVRQQDIINVDVVIVPEGCIEQINISLTLDKTAETVSVK